MDNPFEKITKQLEQIEQILSKMDSKGENNDLVNDERITRKDVCRIYKISFPTLHSCMKNGLSFEKIGRKTLFKRKEVDKYFSGKRI